MHLLHINIFGAEFRERDSAFVVLKGVGSSFHVSEVVKMQYREMFFRVFHRHSDFLLYLCQI